MVRDDLAAERDKLVKKHGYKAMDYMSKTIGYPVLRNQDRFGFMRVLA